MERDILLFLIMFVIGLGYFMFEVRNLPQIFMFFVEEEDVSSSTTYHPWPRRNLSQDSMETITLRKLQLTTPTSRTTTTSQSTTKTTASQSTTSQKPSTTKPITTTVTAGMKHSSTAKNVYDFSSTLVNGTL